MHAHGPGSQVNVVHELSPSLSTSSKGRVALVYMPWGGLSRPSIALGILKECARRNGFTCDVYYLNIWFAQEIGIDLYTKISDGYLFAPEWFFSCQLFRGPGTENSRNSWDSLSGAGGDQLKSELAKMVEGSSLGCDELAGRVVPHFVERCIRDVDWSSYLAIGFSSSFAQNTASLLLAQEIRRAHPGPRILFGGANLDSEMGFEIMRGFDCIDYVVHGEAEQSFPRLLDNIYAGNNDDPVPGVSMRKRGEPVPGYMSVQPCENLNESPAPDYSDFFQQIEHAGFHNKLRVSVPFESARGCWWGAKHQCTFCGLNGSGMTFRRKDPVRVYEELLSLSRRYRCLMLHAVDNIISMDYFTQFLPRLADSGVDFTLFYEVKANLTRNQMAAMRDAGLVHIQPGIESLNSRLLRLMQKGVTAIQNIQLLKWCHEFGIYPLWNVLYGFPEETPDDYADYPRIFRMLSHLCPPTGMGPIIFERFSPYYLHPEKVGLRLQPQKAYSLIFPESRLDLEKLAYYFDGVWEGKDDSFQYMAPSRQVVEHWQRTWKEKTILCYYEKGPDFITIYDNRCLKGETSVPTRRTTLNKIQSRAYLFCDEHRSFSAIHAMLNKEVSPDLSVTDCRAKLQQLVDAGLMFQEGDRYLALAVHKRSRTFMDAV